MIALARSSWSRATASSPRVASRACSSARSSPSSAGPVSPAGWSSAVARRAHPPRLLTTSAPIRINPPCHISFWVLVRIVLSGRCRRPPSSRRPVNPPSIGVLAPPIAARAPALLEQADALDLHAAVHGLDHVVDREQRHGHGRERLHLDSRPAHRLRRRPHAHPGAALVERRGHLDVIETQRVA